MYIPGLPTTRLAGDYAGYVTVVSWSGCCGAYYVHGWTPPATNAQYESIAGRRAEKKFSGFDIVMHNLIAMEDGYRQKTGNLFAILKPQQRTFWHEHLLALGWQVLMDANLLNANTNNKLTLYTRFVGKKLGDNPGDKENKEYRDKAGKAWAKRGGKLETKPKTGAFSVGDRVRIVNKPPNGKAPGYSSAWVRGMDLQLAGQVTGVIREIYPGSGIYVQPDDNGHRDYGSYWYPKEALEHA